MAAPKERNALKAGIFIIVSVALVIAVIIAVSGIDRVTEPWQQRTVTFTLTDDVGGLRIGDDVRIGGFKVGVVRNIAVVSPDPAGKQPPQIVVSFAMPRKYVLRDNANIRIQGTLTGTSWLNIDDMGRGNEMDPRVALVGKPSMFTVFADAMPEFKQVLVDVRTKTIPKVNETIDTYKGTGKSATEFVELLKGNVDPIVQRYYKVADPAAEALGHMRDVLGDGKRDLRQTIGNLSSATGTMKEKLPPIMDKLDTSLGKVQGAMDSATSALNDVKATAANAKDITGSARSVIVGNRSKLDAMIASLKVTGDNLKNASAEIRRSPWRLLYKPKPGEVANLNLYDAARQFAEGANDLDDAAAALRDALQDKNVDETQIDKLMQHLDETFAKFSEFESQLWKEVKE
jgi:phospholipid/cholesterol/gamma-HCH transport system substrate-binding protein